MLDLDYMLNFYVHLTRNDVPSEKSKELSQKQLWKKMVCIHCYGQSPEKMIMILYIDGGGTVWFFCAVRFWPAIDAALRSAACTKGVEVKLMVSCWQHSSDSMFVFLQSLLVLQRPPLRCNINVVCWIIYICLYLLPNYYLLYCSVPWL